MAIETGCLAVSEDVWLQAINVQRLIQESEARFEPWRALIQSKGGISPKLDHMMLAQAIDKRDTQALLSSLSGILNDAELLLGRRTTEHDKRLAVINLLMAASKAIESLATFLREAEEAMA